MNMQNSAFAGSSFLLVLGGLFSFVSMVFWMVVAWRAMRAHEDIADVLRGRSQE